MHYHLITLNCRYSHSCLALFYLRNALERHLPGCRAGMSQLTINDPYYDTLLRISGNEAEALFFSVYIWNSAYTSRLVRDLARLRPDRPIILGGPQAPVLAGLTDRCTVIHGEIEGVADSFYADLQQGRLRPAYRAVSGRPFFSPYRPQDFAGLLANRQIYYESSRGCPFFCSYCLSSVKHGVFHKEIETVRQELAAILEQRPVIIKFIDRTFNDDPHRALAIWRFLAARPGSTRFHFEIAPDRFTDEMFAFLETVPPDLFQFEIGIQSTDQETLAAVNRKMDVELAAANIRRLVRLDSIHLHVDLILGLPCDTLESFRRSFNRVFALEPHYIQMGQLKVLPETAIRNEAENFGIIYCEQPPYEVLATRWLDHRTIGDLHALGECVEAFYNNRFFRSLWRYILNRRREPFLFFQALLATARDHGFFELAHTPELLVRILGELAAGRPDRELLLELLRYDWLRCGHRLLPRCLATTPAGDIHAEMRRQLPQNYAGLFTYRDRDKFLKQRAFLRLSGAALREVGLSRNNGRAGTVCFLPEQTTGVIKHNRAVLL